MLEHLPQGLLTHAVYDWAKKMWGRIKILFKQPGKESIEIHEQTIERTVERTVKETVIEHVRIINKRNISSVEPRGSSVPKVLP